MSHPSAPDLDERIAALSPAKRELLERRLRDRDAKALRAGSIPRRARSSQAPLSFAQQRLWFLDQLEPGSVSYNVPRALRIRGPLAIEALRRALAEIVDRHEVLRTTFSSVDGRPVQSVGERGAFFLPVTDLSLLAPAARESEVARVGREEEQTPFDLASGPLFRARLLRLGRDEHVLMLTNHHIVSDAWSAGVLFRELGLLYGAFAQDKPSPLEPLTIQYSDFAEWQRGPEQSQVLQTQLSYWRDRLSGAPGLLDLPGDRPRPAVPSLRGARAVARFSETLSRDLRAFSQKEGVTLFMTLLAGLCGVLSRYTGREDIVVGSPIAGRTRPELEGLIGCFLNTLVLRADLSGDPTFRELVGRMRETALGAYSHQEMPFEKLVEELAPERTMSYTPLFQVLFILQNAPAHPPELPGLIVDPIPIDPTTAKFDLTLSISEADSCLRARAEYNLDLFEAPTIEAFLGHLEKLLGSAMADPECRVSRLALLAEPEKRRLLLDWNDTAAPSPREGTLPRMFEAQVAKTPDAIAAVFEREAWTYAELNAHANQIARRLQQLGVAPGAVVAICVERSLKMLAALLGILKAGAGYLPIDPAYPKERIGFMMGDAPVAAAVTTREFAEQLSPLPPRVLWLDEDWPALSSQGSENLDRSPEPEDLAYLIYTSGSTGRPKGVEIPHRALANLLEAASRTPGLGPNDVLLSVTTLSFDIAALELYLPLVTGARLILVSREVSGDAAALLERIRRFGVTTVQGTPATWQLLLAGGWDGGAPARVLCGGEALSRELAETLRARSEELWNLYGPTETTIWSAAQRVENVVTTAIAPIGQPLANTRLYVLDRHGELAPIGIPGELFIGGSGIALGYWNRPELTAEKFVPDRFAVEPGQKRQKLYRTGDLVRRRRDGTIDYLGRLDSQVKVRGFRIELGEIEAVLAQHPGVREAAVVVSEDARGDRRLVAHFVAGREPAPRNEILREFLGQRLPDYMIPSAIVRTEKLPLTPNGKVDRLALAAVGRGEIAEDTPFVPPRNPLEESLATLWCGVLDLERVSVEQSFFELGGHSLLATQLVSRIRQQFGFDLPLRALFERPTIAGLAAEIGRVRPKDPAASIARLTPQDREAHRMKR
ncbi:MAG TPA: amino acid adenylation domain-containing protein, partial [Thermoanaerobaculia bacterium]